MAKSNKTWDVVVMWQEWQIPTKSQECLIALCIKNGIMKILLASMDYWIWTRTTVQMILIANI